MPALATKKFDGDSTRSNNEHVMAEKTKRGSRWLSVNMRSHVELGFDAGCAPPTIPITRSQSVFASIVWSCCRIKVPRSGWSHPEASPFHRAQPATAHVLVPAEAHVLVPARSHLLRQIVVVSLPALFPAPF